MWDVYNVCINYSAEAFLHGEVEGFEGDEAGNNVHRDLQVLHCGKTITDIHCEGVIALGKRWAYITKIKPDDLEPW